MMVSDCPRVGEKHLGFFIVFVRFVRKRKTGETSTSTAGLRYRARTLDLTIIVHSVNSFVCSVVGCRCRFAME